MILSRLYPKGKCILRVLIVGLKKTYDEHRAYITCDVCIQFALGEQIYIDNACCDGNDCERRKRGSIPWTLEKLGRNELPKIARDFFFGVDLADTTSSFRVRYSANCSQNSGTIAGLENRKTVTQ